MMSGHILCACNTEGRRGRGGGRGGEEGEGGNRETKKQRSLKMNFKFFFTHPTVFLLQVYYLSEGFKTCLKTF